MTKTPPVFVKRVVGLIELGVGSPAGGPAGQSGVDHNYDEIGVWEMAIGLILLGDGVPKLEAASFILAFCDILHFQYYKLSAERSDRRLFMILKSRALGEAREDPIFSDARALKAPLKEPEFVKTVDDLKAVFSGLYVKEASRLVIEVQDLKHSIIEYLKSAPLSRRGVAKR